MDEDVFAAKFIYLKLGYLMSLKKFMWYVLFWRKAMFLEASLRSFLSHFDRDLILSYRTSFGRYEKTFIS